MNIVMQIKSALYEWSEKKKELTINSNYNVRDTEHKNNENGPDSNLCNPATMVPCISPIILIFDTNHHKSKYCKKQEVPQADTKNSIHLKPFFGWCFIKCIYPWNTVHFRLSRPLIWSWKSMPQWFHWIILSSKYLMVLNKENNWLRELWKHR